MNFDTSKFIINLHFSQPSKIFIIGFNNKHEPNVKNNNNNIVSKLAMTSFLLNYD